MLDDEKTANRFWPTYFLVLTGLLVALIVDGHAWGGDWGVKASGFGLSVMGVSAYFLWRRTRANPWLVRTSLEWVYGLCLLALFGAWLFSPDPRQGLTRIAWLLGYMFLFYFLADALEVGVNRAAMVAALLTFSGFVILLAAMEIYVIYNQWRQFSGSWLLLPPYPYRLISVVGHSNALMGLGNLCAPLALVGLLRTHKTVNRVFYMLWLVLFLLVVPFSSSRGGWLGMAVWMGLLFLYWLVKQNPLALWRDLKVSKKIIVIAAGLVLVALAVAGGAAAFVKFSQHPSHGSNIVGGRSLIWSTAFEIWRAHPWFGTGPGRSGLGYLKAAQSIPPGFWALHAHSLPIQVLAEFGIAGGVAFIALVVENLRWFRERYNAIEKNKRDLGLAILASCAAWATQMLVDDQSGVVVVMVSLIILLAFFINLPETPLERWPHVHLNVLILPCIMLGFGAGWGLWAYAPQARGVAEIQSGNMQTAPYHFSTSMERDPNYSFYAAQTGFAWAKQGLEKGNEAALVNAHQAFEKSLMIEPEVSLFWANMAVVDWHSKSLHDQAIANMQQAIKLSPGEASYALNLAWFYEKKGLQAQAATAYRQVLDLRPNWVAHPFWQVNDLRQQVVKDWLEFNAPANHSEELYWMKARQAISSGDLGEAKLLLAKGEWVGESALAIEVSRGLMAEEKGDRKAAIVAYEKVAEIVRQPVLRGPHKFMMTYTVWMNRRQGITDDLVPGYLQLDTDVGQFLALEKLYATYRDMGECENAARVWQVWQQAVHGGALEMKPLMSGCLKGGSDIGQ